MPMRQRRKLSLQQRKQKLQQRKRKRRLPSLKTPAAKWSSKRHLRNPRLMAITHPLAMRRDL